MIFNTTEKIKKKYVWGTRKEWSGDTSYTIGVDNNVKTQKRAWKTI